mmetsp:Transcript_24818/g.30979  ORF Transcript_24818/g.30979 Transcript_24818/m.30979 type:complete len:305 (+) Transcript_24818:2-916(+)
MNYVMEQKENEEDGEYFGDLGSMFDNELPKARSEHFFNNGAFRCFVYSIIDENPGALQSGQYIWPASPALCEYLVEIFSPLQETTAINAHKRYGTGAENDNIKHKSTVEVPSASAVEAAEAGRLTGSGFQLSLLIEALEGEEAPGLRVMEVGAGCGMVGLVAAQMPHVREVLFTDRDQGALSLIEQAIADPEQVHLLAPCRTACLEWGQEIIDSRIDPSQEGFHLILGSDVIYAASVVGLLFTTVAKLLNENPEACFLMSSSFSYGDEIEEEIDKVCTEKKLSRQIIRCHLNTGRSRVQVFKRI